jgi:hypothetical protein
MAPIDPSEQYRRLQELYAEMSDGRIESMAESVDDLTEIAQQVLRAEISKRGLDKRPQNVSRVEIARYALREELLDPEPNYPFRAPDTRLSNTGNARDGGEDPADLSDHGAGMPNLDPHAFDPVAIWVVTDSEKAREVMGVLETAGIECYLGPENVATVDEYKGDYAGGVEIKVMKFQARHAQDGLRAVLPPEPEEDAAEGDAFTIRCPKCNSAEVILQGFVEEPGQHSKLGTKNSWACDACGHEWVDDGTEQTL